MSHGYVLAVSVPVDEREERHRHVHEIVLDSDKNKIHDFDVWQWAAIAGIRVLVSLDRVHHNLRNSRVAYLQIVPVQDAGLAQDDGVRARPPSVLPS